MGQPTPILRCAIVGAGQIVEDVHLPVLKSLPNVAVVAICDANAARGAQIGSRFRVPRVYGELQNLLNNEHLDFVDIATPPNTHFELAKMGLEAGLHVLVEKPLALSAPEAIDLIHIARSVQRKIGTLQTYRFRDSFLRAGKEIQRGSIGDLRQIGFVAHGGDVFGVRAGWPWDEKGSRLLLYELAIHYVDLMIQFAGPVTEVLGLAAARDATAVTGVHALLRHASGALGTMDVQVGCASQFTHFDFLGTTGDIVVKLFPEHLQLLRGQITPFSEIASASSRASEFILALIGGKLRLSSASRHTRPHWQAMAGFVASLAEPNSEPPISAISVVPVLEALDRLHAAL